LNAALIEAAGGAATVGYLDHTQQASFGSHPVAGGNSLQSERLYA
jgi:hypothetical protein